MGTSVGPIGSPGVSGGGVPASVSQARAASLLSRLAPAGTPAVPVVAIAADIPALTTGAAATVTGGNTLGAHQPELFTEVGSRGLWNNASNRYTVSGFGNVPGLDFYLTGTTIEFELLDTGGAGTLGVWIWVNGAPTTAAPDTITFASTTAFYKLVFPGTGRRRVEIFLAGGTVLNAWRPIRTDITTLVTPSPRKPVVMTVGDSFYSGSTPSPPFQCAPFLLSRMLGVECFDASFGGTGYVATGSFTTFGSSTRTALAVAAAPELLVFSGSLNDDASFASVGAAAAAAYAAYAVACPTAKAIVFGPEPSNATDTVSANRAAQNAAVRAAALAAPNVLGYYDQLGTATGLPPAYSGATTYNHGDLVVYLGSVYKAVPGVGNTVLAVAPAPTTTRWAPQTYTYTGTGKVGSTTGDGTRDIYLYSDGVHPTVEGSAALAIRQANLIRASLLAASM